MSELLYITVALFLKPLSLPGIEQRLLGFFTHSLRTILTELSRLLFRSRLLNVIW
jgi:hypothetical protein